jgi:hypothetical protein
MKNGLTIATLALVGMTVSPAQATTYTFNWVTPANSNTNVGLTESVTSNGITLVAYGLTAPADLTKAATAGPALYAKNGGLGETGLGMAVDPEGDHEISAALRDGIQIDFSDALAKLPNATVTMQVSSSQAGEGWKLYGSNTLYTVETSSKTLGFLGEPLLSGSANYANASYSFNLPNWGQFSYYTLMAYDPTPKDCSSANILLGTVTMSGSYTTTSQTPEPGSLLMAGTALVALGIVMKKKQKRA